MRLHRFLRAAWVVAAVLVAAACSVRQIGQAQGAFNAAAKAAKRAAIIDGSEKEISRADAAITVASRDLDRADFAAHGGPPSLAEHGRRRFPARVA